MADQEVPPPLPSQILAETLELAKQSQAFEPSEIEALTDLARIGGFRKPERLVEVLKNREATREAS